MEKIDNCLSALHSVIGHNDGVLALHEPRFSQQDKDNVLECIESGWVSSVGQFVTQFESDMQDFTGSPYIIAVSNGTAALHICLKMAEVMPDDEVLLPALTFVATANAIKYCSAIPHFIDSDKNTLNIDIQKLEQYLLDIVTTKNGYSYNKKTGKRIKAIIPVHVFGHSVDMNALQALANKFNLSIVEDACESLGSYYKGQHTGNFGLASAFSFNGNKIITTGGGGAIATSDPKLAEYAKHLTTTAKIAHLWEFYHDEVGYNYRLPNLNAALGCAQLKLLPSYLEKKKKLHSQYLCAFEEIGFARIQQAPEYSESNYWLNALILNEPNKEWINSLIEQCKHRYGLRGLWQPLDMLPMYKDVPRMDLQQTHEVYERIILLPSSPHLI